VNANEIRTLLHKKHFNNALTQCVINVFLSRCMRIDEGAGVPVEVADIYCDPVVQSPDLNACHVACPGTCVLGPWSDWSDCPQVCTIVVFSQFSLCLQYKIFSTSVM
jgi:hypothetical protein